MTPVQLIPLANRASFWEAIMPFYWKSTLAGVSALANSTAAYTQEGWAADQGSAGASGGDDIIVTAAASMHRSKTSADGLSKT
jgi:hypothetical protein